MKNVRVLDCTLRDGGRIIDCAFEDKEIKEISDKLANAKIDIVEVGFLRDGKNVSYNGNSTFFTDVDQIKPFIDKSKKHTMYVAFIDYGMFDFTTLKKFDGLSIDGIRFGFTKQNYIDSKDDVIACMNKIKDMGYKLFGQWVNSLNYTDREILELVDMVNEIHPYSFGIVDTYGAMYMDDVDRLYGLIDHNMDADICINFHSHNNYQLSFAFAQEVIKLSRGVRNIIIDATLNGMGKVAGNLNTELIVDYLVRKLHYDYEFDDILDLIDNYIYKYSLNYKWGYSIPAMMAGVYKSHPNNIIYLTEKFRLDTKDIGKILSMIEPNKRQRYDYDNIEHTYIEYAAEKVNDYNVVQRLKSVIGNKEVLMLVPGGSLNTHKESIDNYITQNKPFIISVNFISDYKEAFCFFGNKKRYNSIEISNTLPERMIICSNVSTDVSTNIVNYHGLINRGYKYFENSTIMLLNLLRKLEITKISVAGFDGFDVDKISNYTDDTFQNERHIEEFDMLNQEIYDMLSEYHMSVENKCAVNFITPSRFEQIFKS